MEKVCIPLMVQKAVIWENSLNMTRYPMWTMQRVFILVINGMKQQMLKTTGISTAIFMERVMMR